MDCGRLVPEVVGDIRRVKVIVGEVILDHVSLVATANDKVIDAVGGVNFHDMPEDGPVTDLDHGLWLDHAFFTDSGAEAPC